MTLVDLDGVGNVGEWYMVENSLQNPKWKGLMMLSVSGVITSKRNFLVKGTEVISWIRFWFVEFEDCNVVMRLLDIQFTIITACIYAQYV